MAHFDVVVCGLGAVGSAALYALARRGHRALGIEQFTPGHDRGSSHGASRIIRLSYFEDPSYVTLLQRAYPLWRALERAAGRQLLHVTGIAEIGPPGGILVQGTLASARRHGLAHEIVAASDFMRRFPAFRLPSEFLAVLQPDGGFLEAEPTVLAQVALAAKEGAQIRSGERVRAVEPRGAGVRVVTEHGAIEAGAAIVAAGPWLGALLPDLPVRARVTRQVMAWFAPSAPELFAPDFPVFMIESRHGIHYGFPPAGAAGLKAAKHHHADETVDPDAFAREVTARDEGLIRAALADHLPAANGRLLEAKTCLYTVAPDGDFIIDRFPGCPQIIVASPCSGHGFKFAPVLGEALAELAVDGATTHDLARFRLARFHPRS
jgi:sarcosine oxidase